jgi:putative heme-binding domain-containing protein
MSKLLRSALIWVWCIAGLAQTSNPFAADAGAVDAGARIFKKQCNSCHGKGGHGGRAPDLTHSSAAAGDEDADLFGTISKGIDGTDMEAYGERLTAADIWRVIAFVRSAGPSDAPPSGDAAHGKSIFWGKGGCGNCHAVGNLGNRIGPDLSRIGRRRTAAYLRESLLAPGADIAPNYAGITVIGPDGKSIRGIEKAFDDFSVVLQDFSGKVYSFDRTQVRSVTRDAESLMPAYGKLLSEAELNDLLVYLWNPARVGVKP